MSKHNYSDKINSYTNKFFDGSENIDETIEGKTTTEVIDNRIAKENETTTENQVTDLEDQIGGTKEEDKLVEKAFAEYEEALLEAKEKAEQARIEAEQAQKDLSQCERNAASARIEAEKAVEQAQDKAEEAQGDLSQCEKMLQMQK